MNYKMRGKIRRLLHEFADNWFLARMSGNEKSLLNCALNGMVKIIKEAQK